MNAPRMLTAGAPAATSPLRSVQTLQRQPIACGFTTSKVFQMLRLAGFVFLRLRTAFLAYSLLFVANIAMAMAARAADAAPQAVVIIQQ
jgi:hypothetical protein